MKFLTALFRDKSQNKQSQNTQGEEQEWSIYNGSSLYLEDSATESSVSDLGSSEFSSPPVCNHQPLKHGRTHGQRCPPFGAKSVMGHRSAQEDTWSQMPEVAWLGLQTVRSSPRSQEQEPQQQQDFQSLPHCSNNAIDTTHSQSPSLQRATSSSKLSAGGNYMPPSLIRALSSKALLPVLQRTTSSPASSLLFETVPGFQCQHPLHLFAVFDGHGGSAVAKHCKKHMHLNVKTAFEEAWAEALGESAKHKLLQQEQGADSKQDLQQHHQLERQQEQQEDNQQQDQAIPIVSKRSAEGFESPEEASEARQAASPAAEPSAQGQPCAKTSAPQGQALPAPQTPAAPSLQIESQAAGSSALTSSAPFEQALAAASRMHMSTFIASTALPQLAPQAQDSQQGGSSEAVEETLTPHIAATGLSGLPPLPPSPPSAADTAQTLQATATDLTDSPSSPSSPAPAEVSPLAPPAAKRLAKPLSAPPATKDATVPTPSEAAPFMFPSACQLGMPSSISTTAALTSSLPALKTTTPKDPISAPSTLLSVSSKLEPIQDCNSVLSTPAPSTGEQPCIMAQPNIYEPEVGACLVKAFLQTDQQVLQAKISKETGCTAVVLLTSKNHLWVANCGDSRAILCRASGQTLSLSSDHKASRPDEVIRVEKAGGFVWWERVMGELAVSRAIGDHCFTPYVIAEPEIVSVQRKPSDCLVILATDGLWDVFRNEEAHEVAWTRFKKELEKGRTSQEAAKRTAACLVDKSIDRGSRDNVTVIVVDVRMPGKGRQKGARTSQGCNVDLLQGQGSVGTECVDQKQQPDEEPQRPWPQRQRGEDAGHSGGVVDVPEGTGNSGDGKIRQQGSGKASKDEKQGTEASAGQSVSGSMKGQQDSHKGKGLDGVDAHNVGAHDLGAWQRGVGRVKGNDMDEQEGSLSTTSLPRSGFSRALSHMTTVFSVDEPPRRTAPHQSRLQQQQQAAAVADRPPSVEHCDCFGGCLKGLLLKVHIHTRPSA